MNIKEGKFRGKKIDDMSREELLEVIKYLADEMLYWRKQYDDNYDLILENTLDKVGLKPPRFRKSP